MSIAGEQQVGIRCAVGPSVLDAAVSGVGAVERNANDRGPVSPAVGDLGRRLEAWNQALVAVGRRVGKGTECLGMLEQPADGVETQIAESPA